MRYYRGDYEFRADLIRGLDDGSTPDVNFFGTSTDLANLTTYTFRDRPIGEARRGRVVVVSVHAGPSTVSSATIGGVAATIHTEAHSSTTSSVTILSALVPDGVTATIVITFADQRTRCMIGVWAVSGLNSLTPTGTSSQSTEASVTSMTISDLAVRSGGFAIYAYTSDTNVSYTWSGATEVFTLDSGAENPNQGESAAIFFAGRAATPTVTVSHISDIGCALVGASWR